MHHYNNRKTTEQKAVEGFLKGLWWLISLPYRLLFGRNKRGGGRAETSVSADKDFVANKWREIDQLMELGSPSNYAKAVLEADKLLDHVLKGLRAPGLTMGDRLKASKSRFSHESYNAAWRAHIVRNELVHNAEYTLLDFSARQAIKEYRQAIDELTNN